MKEAAILIDETRPPPLAVQSTSEGLGDERHGWIPGVKSAPDTSRGPRDELQFLLLVFR